MAAANSACVYFEDEPGRQRHELPTHLQLVKDVLQQLPMEFAVEAQKLISVSLEGNGHETSCYCADGVARRLPKSIGPYDAAKPKKATRQAKAVMCSSSSLHAGSNAEQICATPR
jgi:hypothetical protein